MIDIVNSLIHAYPLEGPSNNVYFTITMKLTEPMTQESRALFAFVSGAHRPVSVVLQAGYRLRIFRHNERFSFFPTEPIEDFENGAWVTLEARLKLSKKDGAFAIWANNRTVFCEQNYPMGREKTLIDTVITSFDMHRKNFDDVYFTSDQSFLT